MSNFLKNLFQPNPKVGQSIPTVESLPNIDTVAPGASYYLLSNGHVYTANHVSGLWEFASSVSGGLIFERVTESPKQIQSGRYYLADHPTDRIIFVLPAIINEPDTFMIAGKGDGGWKVIQGGGQQIICGDKRTQLGINGYIESYEPEAVVKLSCVEPNVLFKIDYTFLTLRGND
jgi:hypothetical protein